jgi:hypothetical protein
VTGHGAQSADPTSGDWTCVPTQQVMHDGTILKTWGVQVAGTDQWIGKAHPIGASPENQAEAYANGRLFAVGKTMAAVLIEATQAWADQFDAPADSADHEISVSGGDLVAWFAAWRVRARQVLNAAGVR